MDLALKEPKPSDQPISQREISVMIDVAQVGSGDTGCGVRDVRLFRNGSLVKIWHGDLPLDQSGHGHVEANIPIVAGDNRFTAYAFNRDNIKSSDAELKVIGDESLRHRGVAYVLAVGLDKYLSPDLSLKYSVADAQALADEPQSPTS